jgi:hypothetical protein
VIQVQEHAKGKSHEEDSAEKEWNSRDNFCRLVPERPQPPRRRGPGTGERGVRLIIHMNISNYVVHFDHFDRVPDLL